MIRESYLLNKKWESYLLS